MFLKAWERWKLDKPDAATCSEWKKWKRETKAKYPYRYWLQETLPLHVSVWIRRWVKDTYWAITHRFCPRHQYHIIKPKTLKPGYYDPETRILHSMMEINQEFVENNLAWKHIDWDESSEGHAQAWKTMQEVREWWINVYPHYEDQFKDCPVPYFEERTDEEKELVHQWAIEYHNEEVRQQNETKEMMKKIIDVLEYMWY